MRHSFTLVYSAVRFDAPDALLSWGAEWVYEDDVRGFKVVAVAQEYATRLLDRLREAGALYAPDAYRSLYPTLQSAINNAEAHTGGY
jgi:hypothetical protein